MCWKKQIELKVAFKGLARKRPFTNKDAFQVGLGGPRAHRAKIKDGEKEIWLLSHPTVIRHADSNIDRNSLLFLSGITP
jgi:hypothetical protein